MHYLRIIVHLQIFDSRFVWKKYKIELEWFDRNFNWNRSKSLSRSSLFKIKCPIKEYIEIILRFDIQEIHLKLFTLLKIEVCLEKIRSGLWLCDIWFHIPQ